MPKKMDDKSTDRQVNTLAMTLKKNIANQFFRALKKRKMSQSDLARKMETSRAVVHRMLKEDDPSITLGTIARAASVLDCGVTIRIR